REAGNLRRRAGLKRWSGGEDLNLRPPAPKAGALPGCATPRRHHRVESLGPTISLAEESPGGGERLSAVAHALLLLVGDPAERAAERWIEEHGVVAEAAVPARRLGDHTLHDALAHLLAARPRPREQPGEGG